MSGRNRRLKTFWVALFLAVAIAMPAAVSSLRAETGFIRLAEHITGEANQGVAVGENYFYAIGTTKIGRYDKKTGGFLNRWEEKPGGPIKHLDSGVVVGDRLICAHSNYPELPMTSSVEVWDAQTLEHVESRSFGIGRGSCTWIDRHDGFWWVVFAHYDHFADSLGANTAWTSLVKYDDDWREMESWVLPPELVSRLRPWSNSGGSWGPDGFLYLTGHDEAEIYRVRLPTAGSVLELLEILPLDNEGQGIAWDRSEPGVLYTIKRSSLAVRAFRLEQ